MLAYLRFFIRKYFCKFGTPLKGIHSEITEHSCANNKFFVAKSNKFDYSNEKTCVFQIFFVTLCAETNNSHGKAEDIHK